MIREEWVAHFESSPESVRYYLLDERAIQNEDAAQKKLGFENDAWPRVMEVVWDTVFGKLSQRDFRDRVKKIAGDRKPDEVEKAVLLHIILPLADLVAWDVDTRLQELGVPLGDIQGSFRITLRPVSYGAAVRRIATLAKISLLSEELVRRARDLFVSYVKGIRTVEQMKEVMQRSRSENGIGLTRDQADAFAVAMHDFMATTQVISEQQYADWWREYQEKEEEEKTVVAGMSGEQGIPSSAIGGKSTRDASSELEKGIDEAIALIAWTTPDEYLQRRLRNIVSTRFREVRNAVQAKDMLLRDQKLGGLGMETPEAERLSGIIEQVYVEHHARFSEEERSMIELAAQEQKIKREQKKKEESEEHALWYQQKQQQLNPAAALKEQMTRAFAPKDSGVETTEPGSREKSLDGIVAPKRLTGLTEEVGTMTWEIFRRMSKDPEQASARVQQQLETLKQESFERWTEGVAAWRASPIQQSYLKLVAQSFAAGKPVAAMVEERRATDPSLPSGAEIAALIDLNAKITY